MNEYKKLIFYSNIAIFCSLLSAGLSLFGIIHDIRGADTDVGTKLESIAREQQHVERAVSELRKGIGESFGTVGELRDANNDAQDTADRIGQANSGIREAIDKSREIMCYGGSFVDDSESRFAECKRILKEIRNEK